MTNTNQSGQANTNQGEQIDPRKQMTKANNQKKNVHLEDDVYIKRDNKMLFLDVDLIEVLSAEMKERKKGWASNLISDLLRPVFEEAGLFEKHGIENLKKKK